MIDSDRLAAYHRAKAHKPSTCGLVRCALRHWHRLALDTPTDDALARYRDRRLAEGASPDTVRGELTKLVGVARWIGHVPNVKKPTSVDRCPIAWNRRQLKRLFREARRTRRTIWGLPGRLYWPALLGVAYDSGERIGAVLQLRGAAIDIGGRRVLFSAATRKDCRRDSLARLSWSTRRHLVALDRVRPFGAESVFLAGSPSTLWKAYKRLLVDAGLPADRESKFHRLRRTHATQIYLAGGDAAAALGHQNPATTWRHYIDARQIKRRLPWRPWPWW